MLDCLERSLLVVLLVDVGMDFGVESLCNIDI